MEPILWRASDWTQEAEPGFAVSLLSLMCQRPPIARAAYVLRDSSVQPVELDRISVLVPWPQLSHLSDGITEVPYLEVPTHRFLGQHLVCSPVASALIR